MLGDRYEVKRGDNLWRIAVRNLGSGNQWPRIWKYNNRPEVVRTTGRRIPNPDIIYVGQVLYLPRLPTARVEPGAGGAEGDTLPIAREHSHAASPVPVVVGGPPTAVAGANRRAPLSLAERTRTLRLPAAFKYRLDDLRWPPQDLGVAIVEVRMAGDVLLMSKRAYPATFITSRGEVEAQVLSEANLTFGKLVNDTRLIFDPVQKRVTMRSMLVNQSLSPNTAATAIGVEIPSNGPLPKLRAEIRLSKLEGSYGAFQYIALDTKVVLEITPKGRPPEPPSMQPERIASPKPANSATPWAKVIGTGLVITAGAIVFATIVEDFCTLGAGAADDPASFAAAGLVLARGLAMIRGGAQSIPRAPAPVSLAVTSTVELAR